MNASNYTIPASDTWAVMATVEEPKLCQVVGWQIAPEAEGPDAPGFCIPDTSSLGWHRPTWTSTGPPSSSSADERRRVGRSGDGIGRL